MKFRYRLWGRNADEKFAFLALLLLLYYIAGMYDSPALMMLFLTQLLLMAVMFCLRSYLKRT